MNNPSQDPERIFRKLSALRLELGNVLADKNAVGYQASLVLDSLKQYITCATELSKLLPDLFDDRTPQAGIDTYTSYGHPGTLCVRSEIVMRAYNDICRILDLRASEPRESSPTATEPILRVLRVLDRFPRVARQFRDRYGGREALLMDDEHDVQYLLHALLLIDFEDVRPEEVAPSQGGSSSRIDFLLHPEEIAVETKMTRSGLHNKQLSSEINDDVGKYEKHPSPKTLVCFVYDPGYLIRNPKGFERDHTRAVGWGNLITVVRPQ